MAQPDLERLFSSCGNIITSRILCDNITGRNRNDAPPFAFNVSACLSPTAFLLSSLFVNPTYDKQQILKRTLSISIFPILNFCLWTRCTSENLSSSSLCLFVCPYDTLTSVASVTANPVIHNRSASAMQPLPQI